MPIDALSKITGTAKSVQQVLANSRFGLDFYQREYDWGSMQVAELLDDLTARFRDDFDDSHERSSNCLQIIKHQVPSTPIQAWPTE